MELITEKEILEMKTAKNCGNIIVLSFFMLLLIWGFSALSFFLEWSKGLFKLVRDGLLEDEWNGEL